MKIKKTVIKVVGLIIIIGVIISIWFGLKVRSELKSMSVSETAEIMPGIYCLRDSHVNFYIINRNDTWIMVDAGNKAKNLMPELDKLGIKKDNIDAVFLTHSDVDHVGTLSHFKNVPIYISQQEERIIKGKGNENRALFFKNKADFDYTCVKDDQIIVIDSITIRCVLTPGHTPGSMCFVINGKYLFTGDNFSLENGQVELFNDFFNMDSEIQNQSIRKITTLENIEAVFTGHHGYITSFRNAFRKWL